MPHADAPDHPVQAATASAPGDAPAGFVLRDVEVSFRSGGERFTALDVPSLEIPRGRRTALVGPSGAGKTTLLYVLARIERVTAGTVAWGDANLTSLSEAAADRWRRRSVGFVFQDFHLIPGMTALANVLMPLWFDRLRVAAADRDRARALLDHFAVPEASRPVERLSRGEQQRTALARALLRRPEILFADEPTASLDEATAEGAIEALASAGAEHDLTLVVATHDRRLMERMDARVQLERGRVT